MRILLVVGKANEVILKKCDKKIDIINSTELYLKDIQNFLNDIKVLPEGIFITDDALSNQDEQNVREINLLLQRVSETHHTKVRVLFLTKDFMNENLFKELINKYPNFKLITCGYLRIPDTFYKNAFEELTVKLNVEKSINYPAKEIVKDNVEKKRSFLDIFKTKSKNESSIGATDHLTREIENISRGISRVVALTGHRGCGLTGTAVNVAYEANKRGLSAIIIDMDIDYRSTNMYFSSFHETTKKDEDINASLIRTLARPQDYITTSFKLKDELWIAALGYQFNDKKLIEQFYNSTRLIGLLSVLRSKFNLVILDFPMDLFKTFKDTLVHIDVFGLCVPNNLYSVLSTLKNVEVVLDKDSASYLNAKSRIIVTKYNSSSKFQDDIFVPEKVSKVLSSGLNESFLIEMKVAGCVPYSNEFDTQIESDIPLVNTSLEHEKAYGNILLRLLEGAK